MANYWDFLQILSTSIVRFPMTWTRTLEDIWRLLIDFHQVTPEVLGGGLNSVEDKLPMKLLKKIHYLPTLFGSKDFSNDIFEPLQFSEFFSNNLNMDVFFFFL